MISKLYWLRIEKIDLEKRILIKNEEILSLTNIGSAKYTSEPKGTKTGDPTFQYVSRLKSLQDKRIKLVNKLCEIENETEKYISSVIDPELRLIMRKYYIDGKSWETIAKEIYKYNIDGSTPRKKVNNYLKKVK